MGTNNKNSPSIDRTVINVSPNSKKSSNGPQQRPTPSKSINIKTPNKSQSANNLGQNTKRVGSCSPPNFSFFAASKCFESPTPQSLPKPPTSWLDEETKSDSKRNQRTPKSQRVRKSLNLAVESSPSSCAQEFAKQQNSSLTSLSNDHFTQQLKFLLNVNA